LDHECDIKKTSVNKRLAELRSEIKENSAENKSSSRRDYFTPPNTQTPAYLLQEIVVYSSSDLEKNFSFYGNNYVMILGKPTNFLSV